MRHIKKIPLFLIIFGFIVSSAYATVSNIQITPSNPKVGDTLTLTGMTNPNEDINCQAWFEVNPMVSPPYYGYIMNNVEIPNTPNNFKVIGENVNDLSISVKMGIWVTKSANANSEGIATVSQSNVPTGTYDIKIWGTVKDTSKPIKLKIIASTTVKADDNGNFKYSYKTNNIPEGTTVYLNIGGVNKAITIEGNTPVPPAPPVVNNTNSSNNSTDKEPPRITILSPSKRDYNISNVNFDVIVEDKSDYNVKFYLNDNKLNYKKSGNHYTGALTLKEGNNTFKIIAKDKYNNENSKIIYINYQKQENSENKTVKSDNNTNNMTYQNKSKNDADNTDNKNNINSNNNKNNNIKENNTKNSQNQGNIVYGTVINHVGNATLIISDGTKISKAGDIQIKEVSLPNITLAYYISPNNAEFNKPLILKISINIPKDKELKILYYDEQIKSWKSIPYVYDKNNSKITIDISKSGYYAIKEKNISKEKNNTSIFGEIAMVVKIVMNVIINLIKSKLGIT
ncbi:hypothetical protein [Methanothermococcus okinawensis]|uniref:Uncharacterized protein n=1 Tax=Methanothermococcus okinawensis (strain DSM 14208 / JCM 11175 / IH1) TaxID=647113 RepID=F8AJT4_METOI|nr:hypothetical protein [Methanothermococcus okinawensis]AEH07282.1 hypothetical protein Metok_1316 [Methanothermococcus okinawensis IH1]